MCVCICVRLYVCVCMCVCVRERVYTSTNPHWFDFMSKLDNKHKTRRLNLAFKRSRSHSNSPFLPHSIRIPSFPLILPTREVPVCNLSLNSSGHSARPIPPIPPKSDFMRLTNSYWIVLLQSLINGRLIRRTWNEFGICLGED